MWLLYRRTTVQQQTVKLWSEKWSQLNQFLFPLDTVNRSVNEGSRAPVKTGLSLSNSNLILFWYGLFITATQQELFSPWQSVKDVQPVLTRPLFFTGENQIRPLLIVLILLMDEYKTLRVWWPWDRHRLTYTISCWTSCCDHEQIEISLLHIHIRCRAGGQWASFPSSQK